MPRGGVRKGKKKTTKVGRGSFEQCVGDFCSVPRGGVKKTKRKEKQNVPRGGVRKRKTVGYRLGSMSGTSALCHEVA